MNNILEEMILKEMSTNTHAADINEIYLAYYLAGGSWDIIGNKNDAKQILSLKEKQTPAQIVKERRVMAQCMASQVLSWAKLNGYVGSVQQIWWTARPGVLAQAVEQEISREAATIIDVLIDFGNKLFLGISAKATLQSGDIPFRNPGFKTIQKSLNIDLFPIIQKFERDEIAKIPNIPMGLKLRKIYIRNNPDIQKKTQIIGANILMKLRNELLKKLQSLPQKEAKIHIATIWLGSEKRFYPPYIKVTGHFKKDVCSADIFNPLKNSKTTLLQRNPISFVEVGVNSIGVLAGTHKIFKMRIKYESEFVGSGIKFSGDPW